LGYCKQIDFQLSIYYVQCARTFECSGAQLLHRILKHVGIEAQCRSLMPFDTDTSNLCWHILRRDGLEPAADADTGIHLYIQLKAAITAMFSPHSCLYKLLLLDKNEFMQFSAHGIQLGVYFPMGQKLSRSFH